MKRAAAGALAGIVAAVVIPVAPARAATTVRIRGGGWGHGIGLSQYGAYGRALNGVGAKEIVEHYYSGTRVRARAMPDRIRVGLLQGRTRVDLTSSARRDRGGRVAFRVAGADRRIAAGGSGVAWRVEVSPTGGMRLYRDGERVERNGDSVFGGPERPLQLRYERFGSLVRIAQKQTSYAYGVMEFGTYPSPSCDRDYCMRVVVAPTMQKYLYGLGEVPSSWPQAALRAQVIAARTYALDKVRRLSQHRYPCDCAVYDSTLDQAYIGDSKRTGSGAYWDDWKSAVDATDAKLALYSGEPIQALYSSTSGGHTEHNENVWGGTALPYLRGVRDRPDDVSPHHSWTVKMTRAEFASRLDATYGTGDLVEFDLLRPFGVSGRVTVVTARDRGGARIRGSRRTVRVSGWSLRSALGLRDTLFRVDFVIAVADELARRYAALDGAPGDATTEPYPVPRDAAEGLGVAQDFERGRMTYVAARGRSMWQWGEVLEAYDAAGRERSRLGMPASDVWGPGDYLGARYERGVIVWSQAGAFAVRGRFARALGRAGGVKGPLGVPVSGRRSDASLPDAGRRQAFAGGAVYRSDTGLVRALWGPIHERYVRMGEAASRCGYPTSTVVHRDGVDRATFAGGVITSSAAGVEVACG